LNGIDVRKFPGRDRLAAGRPHLGEGAFEFGYGWASYFDPCVSPRLDALALVADPHLPHAQA
jgi:hypothetical protein